MKKSGTESFGPTMPICNKEWQRDRLSNGKRTQAADKAARAELTTTEKEGTI